jgi:hypothetical protein
VSVIVVDYDCPDGTVNFVKAHFPSVQVVAIKDRPAFNVSIARNLGAAATSADFLMFLDADAMPSGSLGAFLREAQLSEHEFFTWPHGVGECLVPRSKFMEVGGYDEVMDGWGYEDTDLSIRIERAGLRRRQFDSDMISIISHPDEIRSGVGQTGNKWVTHRLNQIYARIRDDLESIVGSRLSEDNRRRARQLVADALRRAGEAMRPVSFVIPIRSDQFDGCGVDCSLAYNMRPTVRHSHGGGTHG